MNGSVAYKDHSSLYIMQLVAVLVHYVYMYSEHVKAACHNIIIVKEI